MDGSLAWIKTIKDYLIQHENSNGKTTTTAKLKIPIKFRTNLILIIRTEARYHLGHTQGHSAGDVFQDSCW